MFTWEEAGLLRQMILVVVWVGVSLIIGAAIWMVVR
jgi:hypothetical protein